MENISKVEKVVVGIVAALVLWVCFFAHLGAIGFVGPDEPRYAEVAREMARSGDWMTPHLFGQPWFEKPVLYYWGAAAGFRMHLSDEVAARLPSGIAALFAVLALAWLAGKIYGTATAGTVFFILPTTIAGLAFARAAGPDMLFSAALAIAMVFAADVLRRSGAVCCRIEISEANSRSAWFSLIFFGVALGFATLAKGPAALILAGGSIALWAAATGAWRSAFRLAHPAAILAFCVVALPWYVICARRNPDFVRTFLLLHNFQRYTTTVFQHRQPFWFFVPVVLLGLLPWIALLAGAAREGARRWSENTWRDSPGFFFVCWVLFPFIFFSFSQSKLPGYILPAMLPLALLLAIGIAHAMEAGTQEGRWILAVTGILWVAGLALPLKRMLKSLPGYASDPLSQHIHLWLECAAAVGILVAILALSRRTWHALILSSLVVAGLAEIANIRILPGMDAYVSARAAGQGLAAFPEIKNGVMAFEVQRGLQFGLDFYLGREVQNWNLQSPDSAWIFTNLRGLEKIEHSGRKFHAPHGAWNWELILVTVGPANSEPDASNRLRKNAPGSVIPSEARNLSSKEASKKRDSSSLRSSE